MLKRFFATSFLFVGLNAISVFSNYSMDAQEPQKNSSALEEYYKTNPWKFIEQKFMVEPDQLGAKKKCSLLSKAFLTNTIIAGIALITDFILTKAFNVNGGNPTSLITSTMVPLTPVMLIFDAYWYSHSKQKLSWTKEIDILIGILDNFENTKNQIPQELHTTFETLKNIVQNQGRKALEKEWLTVQQHIKDTVKYEKLPAKYAPPVVNNYYNSDTN